MRPLMEDRNIQADLDHHLQSPLDDAGTISGLGMIRLDEHASDSLLPDLRFDGFPQLRAASRDDQVRAFICEQ